MRAVFVFALDLEDLAAGLGGVVVCGVAEANRKASTGRQKTLFRIEKGARTTAPQNCIRVNGTYCVGGGTVPARNRDCHSPRDPNPDRMTLKATLSPVFNLL